MGGVANTVGGAIGGVVGGVKDALVGKAPNRVNIPGFGDVRPDRPEFQSMLAGGDAGRLRGGFAMDEKRPAILQNRDALNMLRADATAGPGKSAWESMARQNLANSQGQARTRLAEDLASQQATARSNLAMRGGISGGARERMAQQGIREQFRGQQGLAQQGIAEGGNIGLQAEQMRQQQLMALPGMELAAISPELENRRQQMAAEQFNIQNALGEKRAKDQADMQAYLAQMKDWAAAQQAGNIAGSGPDRDRGGLLGFMGK